MFKIVLEHKPLFDFYVDKCISMRSSVYDYMMQISTYYAKSSTETKLCFDTIPFFFKQFKNRKITKMQAFKSAFFGKM
jgi:hypothetical protein